MHDNNIIIFTEKIKYNEQFFENGGQTYSVIYLLFLAERLTEL